MTTLAETVKDINHNFFDSKKLFENKYENPTMLFWRCVQNTKADASGNVENIDRSVLTKTHSDWVEWCKEDTGRALEWYLDNRVEIPENFRRELKELQMKQDAKKEDN